MTIRILPLLVLLLLVGCGAGDGDAEPVASDLEPMPWAGKPFAEWPRLTLTNEARFKRSTPMEGASAFLVKNEKGTVFVATALHLIGEAGGVEPPVAPLRLGSELDSWRVMARNVEGPVLAVTRPTEVGLRNRLLDWLIMEIDQEAVLPSTPLVPRRQRVQVGETVHLIGVPYSDQTSPQNRYSGKVTARQLGSFRFDINPPVDVRGFSGAPIVDDGGYVVGVMGLWFDPRMDGDQDLETGGQDIADILDELGKL